MTFVLMGTNWDESHYNENTIYYGQYYFLVSPWYSEGKLDEQWMKMDKICHYGWKIVEMDENMIDECMNPQYMLYLV